MSGPASDLVDALRGAGIRVTAQRRAVCDALSDFDSHQTVADLHRAAQAASGLSFDISTVYRTIDALEGAGLVHHVHLGHGPSVIHVTRGGEHHHLVCDVCGRTEDVDLPQLEAMTRHIESQFGFVVDGVHFALVGRCVEHVETRNTE